MQDAIEKRKSDGFTRPLTFNALKKQGLSREVHGARPGPDAARDPVAGGQFGQAADLVWDQDDGRAPS